MELQLYLIVTGKNESSKIMKNKNKGCVIEKAYWYDHKPSDDNKGFIYGIYYIEEDLNETIECEWFKTRQERNQKFKKEK